MAANPPSLLDISPRVGLRMFLYECSLIPSIDVQMVLNVAARTLRYLTGSQAQRELLEAKQTLQQRWYAALTGGAPDWGVYDTDEYLGELWACWVIYSRSYLRALRVPRPDAAGRTLQSALAPVRSVVDLGCGFGYTTAALTELFPSVPIIGTNLPGVQMRLAQQIARRYGFTVVSTLEAIGQPVDLVFASEYFEHIPEPVDHLADVLRILQPRTLIIANAFTAPSIGHFDTYRVAGQNCSGQQTAKHFNDQLRAAGYQKLHTQLWNNRPTYWQRTP